MRHHTLSFALTLTATFATAAPPEIVSTSPPLGSTDVDPSTTTVLTVTFDQPMAAGFSWTGGGEKYPQIPAGNQPYWSLDQKTCSLPVQLESGKSYLLGINSRSHRNFKNLSGEPVKPVVFSFSTRGGDSPPADKGGDVLLDDDLESGQATPTGWTAKEIDGVRLTWDDRVAHSGKRSLRLMKTANRYFPIASWSKRIEHSQNDAEAIRFEAFVKANKAKKVVLDVQFLGASGQPISHKWAKYIGEDDTHPDGVTADWAKYGGTVAIPNETTAFDLGIQIYGPGTVWVDDVKATYAPATDIDTD